MKVDSLLAKIAGLFLVAAITAGCSSTSTMDSNSGSDSSSASSSMDSGDSSAASSSSANNAAAVETGPSADDITTVFYFDFDQSTLKSSTRADLDAAADYLKTTSGSIRLEGHADERGSREYNLALGERRAKAVANYLAIQGVDRSRFDIISYGEEKPARLGSGESSWSKNRRAELKL